MFNTRTITCSLAAAAVGILFIGSHAAAQQGGPSVTVVNTPLPVTVTNPTVPPSTVNIGNPAALAAANAQVLLGTPTTLSVGFGTGFPNSSAVAVPVGKRFVIEYTSGQCFLTPGFPSPNVHIIVSTNGVASRHFLNYP